MPRLPYDNVEDAIESKFFWAKITAIYSEDDTADIKEVNDKEQVITPEKVHLKCPIYYHCNPEVTQSQNQSLKGSASAFKKDDIVYCRRDPEPDKPKIISGKKLKTCFEILFIFQMDAYTTSKYSFSASSYTFSSQPVDTFSSFQKLGDFFYATYLNSYFNNGSTKAYFVSCLDAEHPDILWIVGTAAGTRWQGSLPELAHCDFYSQYTGEFLYTLYDPIMDVPINPNFPSFTLSSWMFWGVTNRGFYDVLMNRYQWPGCQDYPVWVGWWPYSNSLFNEPMGPLSSVLILNRSTGKVITAPLYTTNPSQWQQVGWKMGKLFKTASNLYTFKSISGSPISQVWDSGTYVGQYQWHTLFNKWTVELPSLTLKNGPEYANYVSFFSFREYYPDYNCDTWRSTACMQSSFFPGFNSVCCPHGGDENDTQSLRNFQALIEQEFGKRAFFYGSMGGHIDFSVYGPGPYLMPGYHSILNPRTRTWESRELTITDDSNILPFVYEQEGYHTHVAYPIELKRIYELESVGSWPWQRKSNYTEDTDGCQGPNQGELIRQHYFDEFPLGQAEGITPIITQTHPFPAHNFIMETVIDWHYDYMESCICDPSSTWTCAPGTLQIQGELHNLWEFQRRFEVPFLTISKEFFNWTYEIRLEDTRITFFPGVAQTFSYIEPEGVRSRNLNKLPPYISIAVLDSGDEIYSIIDDGVVSFFYNGQSITQEVFANFKQATGFDFPQSQYIGLIRV